METILISILFVGIFAILNAAFTAAFVEEARKKRVEKRARSFEKTIKKLTENNELFEVSVVKMSEEELAKATDKKGETVDISSVDFSKFGKNEVHVKSHESGIMVSPKTHKMLAKAGIVKAQPTTKKKGDYSKKLSPKDVAAIKRASKKITHRALAKQYGVSEGRIGQIRRSAK